MVDPRETALSTTAPQPAPALSRRERRQERARQQRRVAGVTIAGIATCLVFAIFAAGMTSTDRSGAADESGKDAPRRTKAASAVRAAPSTSTSTSTTTTTVSPFPAPPPSGVGRRIVYCNSCQRVWIIEADERVSLSYAVSGRAGVPRPDTYHVQRKLVNGWSKEDPSLRLPYFVGFAWGSTTDIGFHGIPINRYGNQIQSDAQLGSFRSAGCVRQNQITAKLLYDWAQPGDTVVVTA